MHVPALLRIAKNSVLALFGAQPKWIDNVVAIRWKNAFVSGLGVTASKFVTEKLFVCMISGTEI